MKYILFSRLTVVVGLLFICQTVRAQWTLVHSTPEVDVFENMEVIDDMANGVIWEYYNFRYVNKTAAPLQIDWYFEIYIDNQCNNCDGGPMEEYMATLSLAANETYTCDPMGMEDRRRVLNRRIVNQNTQVITDYVFRDFTITPE